MKLKGLLITLIAYIAAFAGIYFVYPYFEGMNIIVIAGILDLVATAIVFIFSLTFNNSSIYDPYWSIAPFFIILFWILQSSAHDIPLRSLIILSLVIIWGFRLTLNWTRRWTGLLDEDWRYVNFRRKFPGFYWPISFLGIHIFPTILVFLGCLSVYKPLTYNVKQLFFTDFVAIIITLTAILIETLSDEQLKAFLKTKPEKGTFLKSGLWKYSRHPNYFGEVLFWTGLFLFSANSIYFEWYSLTGPIAMILLFNFISVPMIDKRMLERKIGYKEYMRTTSGWIPWRIKD